MRSSEPVSCAWPSRYRECRELELGLGPGITELSEAARRQPFVSSTMQGKFKVQLLIKVNSTGKENSPAKQDNMVNNFPDAELSTSSGMGIFSNLETWRVKDEASKAFTIGKLFHGGMCCLF